MEKRGTDVESKGKGLGCLLLLRFFISFFISSGVCCGFACTSIFFLF